MHATARYDETQQHYLIHIMQGDTPKWDTLPAGMWAGQHHMHVKARNRALELSSPEYVEDGDWGVVEAFAQFAY